LKTTNIVQSTKRKSGCFFTVIVVQT